MAASSSFPPPLPLMVPSSLSLKLPSCSAKTSTASSGSTGSSLLLKADASDVKMSSEMAIFYGVRGWRGPGRTGTELT